MLLSCIFSCDQFEAFMNEAVTLAVIFVLSLWILLSGPIYLSVCLSVYLFLVTCIVSVCGHVHLSAVALGGQKCLIPFIDNCEPSLGAGN